MYLADVDSFFFLVVKDNCNICCLVVTYLSKKVVV